MLDDETVWWRTVINKLCQNMYFAVGQKLGKIVIKCSNGVLLLQLLIVLVWKSRKQTRSSFEATSLTAVTGVKRTFGNLTPV